MFIYGYSYNDNLLHSLTFTLLLHLPIEIKKCELDIKYFIIYVGASRAKKQQQSVQIQNHRNWFLFLIFFMDHQAVEGKAIFWSTIAQ